MQSGRGTAFVVALGVLAAAASAHAWSSNLSSDALAGGVVEVEGEAPPPFEVELRSTSPALATASSSSTSDSIGTAASGPSGPSGPSAPTPSGPGPSAPGPSGPAPTVPGPSAPGPSGPQPPATAAAVVRLAGPDRIATAIAVSQDAWTADEASVVVLARSDAYMDALVGVPLAHNRKGPLLLTGRESLDPRVLTEIQRVLANGATVHVLGGLSALSAGVASSLVDAGFVAERHGGDDRYATAIQVAQALGSPTNVFLATGRNFSDALTAGAAAAKTGRALLLTDGDRLPPAVQQYLTNATAVAIGGPAARAVPGAQSIVGEDRYGTGFNVAMEYFDDPSVIGLATGQNFPDGLSGGAHIATHAGPLLITPGDNLHPGMAAIINELPATGTLYLYGGPVALSADVEAAAVGVVAPP